MFPKYEELQPSIYLKLVRKGKVGLIDLFSIIMIYFIITELIKNGRK